MINIHIDEFLDSNKTSGKVGNNTIVKIKYNENIDFIYRGYYGQFEYGSQLNFLGMFEKITKKLYGSSLEFQPTYNKDSYSNYYAGEISTIRSNLVNASNTYLNTYIEKNKLQLMNMSGKIFDEYISDQSNYNRIKRDCIEKYIYQNDTTKKTFSINTDRYENTIKDLVISYIQNPIETSKKMFDTYINCPEKNEGIYFNNKHNYITVKEWIGIKLLQQELEYKLICELKDNPNNEYKKKHDIITSIKDLDAQMFTITIKHNDQIIKFKYPRSNLYRLDYSDFKIPDLKDRDKMETLYKGLYGKDDLFISEIIKIEYSKKIIYEDKTLLNKEIESPVPNETHDIVDEMFE